MGKYNQPLYDDIAKAQQGDIDALKNILEHYDRYIKKLSLVHCVSSSGREYVLIDEDIESDLKIKLLLKTLAFKEIEK